MDDDKEFKELLAEKRHKEISKTLQDIATSLSQKREQDVVSAIEKQTKVVERFVQEICTFEKAEPKIEIEQEKVIQSISEMGDAIIKGLAELKENISKEKDNKKWEFSVQRGYGGIIEKIIATQK